MLGVNSFAYSDNLTAVSIPSSIENIAFGSFRYCPALMDYQLYWETNPLPYNTMYMAVNDNAILTIPYHTWSVYVSANYPRDRLVERNP